MAESIQFSLAADDPNGDTLTYSADHLPDGAAFDQAAGVFSWTPDYNQAGTYNVYFTVSDGELTDSMWTGIRVRWSASPMPQWLVVDLEAIHGIDRVELVPYMDRAYQYKVEVSVDGIGYILVADRLNNTETGSSLVDYFAPTDARYIRLTLTSCHSHATEWASVSGFRVFSAGGAAPAPTPSPTPTP
ncbi:MAG: discoidin domain-containing protein [Bacteroidota bacterium]